MKAEHQLQWRGEKNGSLVLGVLELGQTLLADVTNLLAGCMSNHEFHSQSCPKSFSKSEGEGICRACTGKNQTLLKPASF